MHSQLKGQVFSKAGTSYLVLNPDPESSDWLWVRAIKPDRTMLRMHRDEIASCLQNADAPQARLP